MPGRARSGSRAPLPVYSVGQRIHDLDSEREGEIVDVARKYAHPTADPVHNYLIRWDDGIVEAFHERAMNPSWGLEVDE
jgi:hypothetical protein